MARKSAAQRYQEQVARRAQPLRKFFVTIRAGEYSQGVIVKAVDEWLARNEAMRACTLDINGAHVDFEVCESH